MGGIFSFSAMAVGGGNVAVSLGLGSTVVVNVIDVFCPFCFCFCCQLYHCMKLVRERISYHIFHRPLILPNEIRISAIKLFK